MSTKKKVDKFVLAWCTLAFIASVIAKYELMYVGFFLVVMREIISSKGYFSRESIITILIWSCFLPDNYVVCLVSLLTIPTIVSEHKFNKLDCLVFLNVILFILGIFINSVPLANVVMSVFYFMPTLLIFLFVSSNKTFVSSDYINRQISQWLYIESFAVLGNIVSLLIGIQRNISADDWATGTLGDGQVNILFMIFAVFFVYEFQKVFEKQKKEIIKLIAIVAILLCTRSFTLLAVLMIVTAVMLLSKIKSMKSLMLVIVMGVIGSIGGYYYLSQRGYISLLVSVISNTSVRNNLIGKLAIYEALINELKNAKFLFFGSGPGMFNSRAAASCSGLYVSWYNKIFSPSMSAYFIKYFLEPVTNAHLYGYTSAGSILSLPYSSLVAIAGEYGFLGITSFFVLCACIFRKSKDAFKWIGFFIILACFLDNWLEYPKIMAIVLVFFMGNKRIRPKLTACRSLTDSLRCKKKYKFSLWR